MKMVVASRQSANSMAGAGLNAAVGPGQRHHDAGRPAGELGGLVEIGRSRLERGESRHKPLLEAQRIAAVLVVARVPAELRGSRSCGSARSRRGWSGALRGGSSGNRAQAPPPRPHRAASSRRRARPCAARPRSNRAAPPPSAAGTADRAAPASRPPSSATITCAVFERRKRCRLRRDSRSVANTLVFKSSTRASMSPRSALRTRTGGAGAWARLGGIVTNGSGEFVSLSPSRSQPLLRFTTKMRGESTFFEREPVCAAPRPIDSAAAKSRRSPKQNQAPTIGGIPPPQVAIGACAPIHPRVGLKAPARIACYLWAGILFFAIRSPARYTTATSAPHRGGDPSCSA